MTIDSLLPEGLDWCIAGGYAACPALANDIDVWVFADSKTDAEQVRKEILAHLLAIDVEFEGLRDHDPIMGRDDEYPDRLYARKVANVKNGRGKTTQIMVTTAYSAEDLIRDFDISTHQIALTRDMQVVKGEDWNPITEPPVVIAEYPATPERMRRICTRYGHEVPIEYNQAF